MPHINRIRVNNVKYNFGTQFYDDFILRFDGRNALYDLANGGGKSVLMLLLFQNLIPNCTLDDKQPIEKLFRTEQGSKTIHSLIEWKLDDRFIHDGYKYMLTGFCVRKAREELRETAAIEYFNYVLFYRGYNDNDLVNLPLSDGKERVTYTGLKSYLKELGRRDMGIGVHIFERKGEYQRFISSYGLYESHWEILRGINKTEGHVRTYFENRYKTTRRVVEDLLIEEVIQRAFQQNGRADGDMADTLIQIKDKLAELASRKEEMGYYDRQAEILEGFSSRVELLKKVYAEKEALDTDMIRAYHTVTGINRKKEKELAVCQKEKEHAEKHIREISRKLDTLKIQESQEHLKWLEADTEKYAAGLEQMKQTLNKKEQALALAESVKDYADYLQVKKKWETLKIFLSQDKNDSEGLLEELQRLARIRFALNQEERQLLNKKVWSVEKAAGETAELLAEAQEKERRMFSEGAVLQSQMKEISSFENEGNRQYRLLCKKVPVLFMENIGRTLREKKQQRGANELKYWELMNLQTMQETEIQRLTLEQEDHLRRRKYLEAEKADVKVFMDSYAREKEKRDKLVRIYRADDGESLMELIDRQIRKVILDGELKRREIERLKKQLDNFRQGSPAVPSAAVETVIEYIRRCHGLKCIFGGDYLKNIDDYDRKILLERIPFLPEAVILESGLSKIKEDRVLLEMDLGDGLVPVISLAQVMRQEEVVTGEEILFLSQNPEWYKDAALRQEAGERLEKILEENRNTLERLKDRERTMDADRKYMAGFELNYRQHYAKRAERQRKIEEELAVLEEKTGQNEAALKACETSRDEAVESLKKVNEENQALDEDIDVLEQMKAIDERLTTLQEKKRQLETAIQENENQQKQAGDKLQWARETGEALAAQKRTLREALEQMENQWHSLYETYYVPGETGENNLTGEALDVRFKALKESYEKEHSDLEDKKQLLESYQQMMDTTMRMIQKRGVETTLLETMAKERRLIPLDAAAFETMEQELSSLKAEIERQADTLFQFREDKNKLFGSVAHGVSTIEEKYGAFQRVEMPYADYAAFMEQQRQALTEMKEKYQKTEDSIQNAYRDLRAYDDIKRDLERTIRNENLRFNRTKETYGMDVDIRRKHREINEKYQRLRTEIQRKREGFERDKEKTVESLNLLSASELSEAIRTETGIPTTASEAGELMGQLAETAQIVRLEKERIEKTIRDMVQIKEKFERQCLQRCVSIKAELERFPVYSRIVLDGKQIPTVMLQIPYVKEEMYAQRMSEYIDDIVARTDDYSTQEERVAYIRQQLSWKRLFSVIVTDMNSIRLKLYKRERVKEQSRYLKYEEAVGSTGQSQGIYIQFLIGVINYISMVYSGGGDGSNLKKVIFIDNPFGAAKDIYIWQPIFELLRKNHVQLIVPTRGATPAITGKFDINYILGQKMIDKMQQTVVVDYSSNVDVASMEYEKLEFEQEVFDFI